MFGQIKTLKMNEIKGYVNQTVAVFGSILNMKEYWECSEDQCICGIVADGFGTCRFRVDGKLAEEFSKLMYKKDIYVLLIGEIGIDEKDNYKIFVQRFKWI
jgi:hypothetical protein